MQLPGWPDQSAADEIGRQLSRLPPLVFAGECDALTERLAAVSRGEAFVLQGGDCAETFEGSTADAVRGKLQTLLQMAVVLTYGARVPIIKIGRMAGQFAKPRSSAVERRNGIELPAYRGDAINGLGFSAAERTPDPGRMIRAYHCAAVTLNLCRAFTTGGYADLHRVHAWNQDFVGPQPGRAAVRAAGRRDRPGAGVHAGLRRRPGPAAVGRAVLQPRGADAGLRAGADPDRLADRPGPTARPGTCSGWASGPGRWTARTSSSPAASATRSG